MILLWGIPSDEPLMAVRRALQRSGGPAAFLDQRSVLDTEIELAVGASVTGCMRVGGDELDLGEVTAVYLRPYESVRMPAVARAGADSVEAGHALSVEDALVSWLDLTPALVVNRPGAMAANTSKPYQAMLIREGGFTIPSTLLTTDPQAAADFVAEHGNVIYKSMSGVRSIVSRLRSTQRERLRDVQWCPTQFQQYVPGLDVRVHVVGEEIFACEIASPADDYRYAARGGEPAELRPVTLPPECAERCRRLAAAMDLPVAGIDLRHAPDGTWYCFEVNPAPGFTYFQEATRQPIDEAIARLLLSAEPSASVPGLARRATA